MPAGAQRRWRCGAVPVLAIVEVVVVEPAEPALAERVRGPGFPLATVADAGAAHVVTVMLMVPPELPPHAGGTA